MKKYVILVLLLVTACSAGTTMTPTDAVMPSPTLARLHSVTPPQETSTTTPVPTKYPPVFAEQKVAEYLRTNAGCNLPCFWSVVPGDTSLDDAVEFFQPFGINNKYAVGLYILSKQILNGATLLPENGKIVGVHAFGEGESSDISTFWETWESYLPQNIIMKYGYPQRVWFDTYNNPEVPDPDKPLGYSIWFFYDESDFLIIYSGITSKSPQYQVCLGGRSAEEGIGNLSPEIELLIHRNLALEVLAIQRGIDQKVNFYASINPELPVEYFKEIYNEQNSCFETPSERLP
jgi:hypothetical protein